MRVPRAPAVTARVPVAVRPVSALGPQRVLQWLDVLDVTIELSAKLARKRGAPPLWPGDLYDRISSFEQDPSSQLDERFVRRLKRRKREALKNKEQVISDALNPPVPAYLHLLKANPKD
jgi:hypothetical protein